MAPDENSRALRWLPRAPNDFAQRCRQVAETADEFGSRIRALAGYDLDENQLNRIANAIGKARKVGYSLAPLTPFRLGILSNSTTDFMVPALIASAARHGIDLECVVSEYGQVMQAALSPESHVNRSKPDAVLIAVDYRGYPLDSRLGNLEDAEGAVAAAFGQLDAIRSGIHANGNACCIVQNLAPPVESLFGSLDKALPGALGGMIEEMNRRTAASIWGTKDVLFDVAGLAAEVGLSNWHSPQHWNMAKLPFSGSYMPLYAERVTRTIAAMRGKSRRCLVLDLDNTLWGGVVGDDGLEGIQLAQGDATGEAYLSVQRYALALRERGVVLAVSSKNTDEIARAPFRKHPEMLLHEEHIAVFQANWNDKATNIKAIAEELSLGLESFVFLDDNPVERGIVREFLPQVAVPELPRDPALYVRTLSAAGYFESVTFSDEDLRRAQYYQDNARRAGLQNQFTDIESYLASLKMVITFQPFDETGRARISQLINKSNQFNLTTHRYTEADVAALEQDPACFTLQVRLADTFGDNGMISVVICRDAGDSAWEFDTWLMSCRVLGRRVEEMVLQEALASAKRAGVSKLIGRYIPTERNALVEDHYAKLGFRQISHAPDGSTVWELAVDSAQVQSAPMEIRRVGFAEAFKAAAGEAWT
jgi:FkbH-like protein